MRWEGADPILLEEFYRAVVQAVLLFGADTWFLPSSMGNTLEGVHTELLQQVTGKIASWHQYRSWWVEGADIALHLSGTQLLRTYINRRQATVTEWVATRTIFEVCVQEETGYTGGGRQQALCWRQLAVDA